MNPSATGRISTVIVVCSIAAHLTGCRANSVGELRVQTQTFGTSTTTTEIRTRLTRRIQLELNHAAGETGRGVIIYTVEQQVRSPQWANCSEVVMDAGDLSRAVKPQHGTWQNEQGVREHIAFGVSVEDTNRLANADDSRIRICGRTFPLSKKNRRHIAMLVEAVRGQM